MKGVYVGLLTTIKCAVGLKVDCYVGFLHHPGITTYVYIYSCILPFFVQKWNKIRFVNHCCTYVDNVDKIWNVV